MINITVSGPGAIVDFEAELVIRALQQVGYLVEVHTNYNKVRTPEEMELMMAFRTKLIQTRLAEGKPAEVIKVDVDHLPWGG